MVYFVATPIGNLKEITLRALDVLTQVDAILCEDTRHSATLLKHYNINKPLLSYHKFNEKSMLNKIHDMLQEGKDIAVISDAGMPCINDPGNILVNQLIQWQQPYTVVSGANACINAFVLSGYVPPFTYLGFLPNKTKERNALLQQINTDGVLILYVSVHDLEQTRQYLLQKLGARKCCWVKEISKLHERATHTTLDTPIDDDKGEFVLVIDRQEQKDNQSNLSLKEQVEQLIESGFAKNEAIKQVAKQNNVNKNTVYQLFVEE